MRQITIASVIFIVLLLILAWVGDRALLRLFTEFFFVLVLAQLWNLLAGYAGLVSVGQHALVAIGGYSLFVCTMQFEFSLYSSLLLSAAFAAMGATVMFLMVSRLSGAYFSIGTWVVAEIGALVALQTSVVGGATGMSLSASVVRSLSSDGQTREIIVFLVTGILAGAVCAAIILVMMSRYGLALRAIRDNPRSARSVGINIDQIKFSVFAIVGALSGLLGAIIFFQKVRISPSAAFNLNEFTAIVIFVVIVGGLGSVPGPIIGTIIYFIVREALADYGNIYLVVLGCIAVAAVTVFPQGIWGRIETRIAKRSV
jgi:branched-chain amino acid transport system permease protein